MTTTLDALRTAIDAGWTIAPRHKSTSKGAGYVAMKAEFELEPHPDFPAREQTDFRYVERLRWTPARVRMWGHAEADTLEELVEKLPK